MWQECLYLVIKYGHTTHPVLSSLSTTLHLLSSIPPLQSSSLLPSPFPPFPSYLLQSFLVPVPVSLLSPVFPHLCPALPTPLSGLSSLCYHFSSNPSIFFLFFPPISPLRSLPPPLHFGSPSHNPHHSFRNQQYDLLQDQLVPTYLAILTVATLPLYDANVLPTTIHVTCKESEIVFTIAWALYIFRYPKIFAELFSTGMPRYLWCTKVPGFTSSWGRMSD